MKKPAFPLKPRNPLIAVSRFLKAGAHGKTRKAQRKAARMQLKNLRPADWQRDDKACGADSGESGRRHFSSNPL